MRSTSFVVLLKEALHCIEPPAKFGSHSPCGSGDKTYLISHVTSLMIVTIMPGSVPIGIMVVEIKFLISHFCLMQPRVQMLP